MESQQDGAETCAGPLSRRLCAPLTLLRSCAEEAAADKSDASGLRP